MNLFNSAVIRLTLWYLLIITVLSTGFSVALYRVSSSELNLNLDHLSHLIDQGRLPSMTMMGEDLVQLRINQLEETKDRLIADLLYFNLLVIVLGGFTSYFLALRTLEPIEEALESQNRFAADASHELRTPLATLATEIEVALRDKKLSADDARLLLKSNLEEVNRLTALSSSLLKVTGRAKPLHRTETSEVSIRDLIERAAAAVKHSYEQHKVSLNIEPGDASLHCDPTSLTELFSILLDNAAKYSEAESTVQVSIQSTSTSVGVRIRDHGVGIAPADIPHIFDRFYRVDRSRSKADVEGHGLGLSIAKRITEMHHGSISVTSKPKEGSSFTVKLPRVQPT